MDGSDLQVQETALKVVFKRIWGFGFEIDEKLSWLQRMMFCCGAASRDVKAAFLIRTTTMLALVQPRLKIMSSSHSNTAWAECAGPRSFSSASQQLRHTLSRSARQLLPSLLTVSNTMMSKDARRASLPRSSHRCAGCEAANRTLQMHQVHIDPTTNTLNPEPEPEINSPSTHHAALKQTRRCATHRV